MKKQVVKDIAVGFATLSFLVCSISFSKTQAIAWWSVIYPSSLYEAGVFEEQTTGSDEEHIQVKWKLAEWISGWF